MGRGDGWGLPRTAGVPAGASDRAADADALEQVTFTKGK